MKKGNKKGFTLVELLAVIVILVIILLIALPNFSSSIQRNKEKQLVKIEKSVKNTGELYVQDNIDDVEVDEQKYCYFPIRVLTKNGYISDDDIEGYINGCLIFDKLNNQYFVNDTILEGDSGCEVEDKVSYQKCFNFDVEGNVSSISFDVSVNKGNEYSKSKTGEVIIKSKHQLNTNPIKIYYVWGTEEQSCSNMVEFKTVTPLPGVEIVKVQIPMDGETGAGKLYVCNGSVISDNSGDSIAIGEATDNADMYLDNEVPSISSISVSEDRKKIYAVLNDEDSKIAYYAVTTSDSEPSQWTSVGSSVEKYNLEYTTTSYGTYYIWAKDTVGNFTSTSISTIISIDKPNIQLCDNKTYNGESQQLTKEINGDGYILNGYNGTDVGNYTITATLLDGYRWNDGSSGNVTFECSINKKSVTLVASSSNKVYDGNALTNNSCTATGLVSGHIASCTMNSLSTITNVGSVDNVISSAIIKNGSTDVTANYSITYTDGALSITKKELAPIVSASNKTYDGGINAVCSVSLNGIVSGDTVVATATGTFDNKNVGTKKKVTCSSIALTGGSVSNYSLSATSATTTANITAKALTISAYSTDWVSGATTYKNSGYSTGVNSEKITLTYTPYTNTAGTYTYATSAASGKFTLALSDNTNYSISSAGDLTINKIDATCPTLTAYSGTYDGDPHGISVSGGLGGTIQYSSDNSTWSTMNPTYTDYTSSAKTTYVRVVGDSNHNTVTCGSKTVTINKATCGTPSITAVSTAGIVTFTAGTNASSHQISIDNSSWAMFTSGSSYLNTITASTGSRTVYVRAVCDSTNFHTPSAPDSAAVSVYKVTISSNSTTMGTVNPTSLNVISGATYSTSSNVLTLKGGSTTLGTSTATAKTGYSFSKWSSTSGTITAATTLTAIFAANRAKITLDANSCGKIGGTNPFYAEYGTANEYTTTTESTAATAPTFTVNNGYTFNGWYTATSGGSQVLTTAGALTGTAVSGYTTASSWVATADKTLYAQCSKNSYTVTYNYSTNGGASFNAGNIAKTEQWNFSYGSAIDLTPTATKSGWTFVGWNTSASATSKLTSLNMGTSDVTLYAIFKKEAITYTATFQKENDNISSIGATSLSCTIPAVYNTATQATKCSITLPTITPATNYYHIGWYPYSDFTADEEEQWDTPGTTVNLSSNKTYSTQAYLKNFELTDSNGSTDYRQNLISALSSDYTNIKLLRTHSDASSAASTVASGKSYTFDTNGKTLTLSKTITNNGTLSITGSGTIANTTVSTIITHGTLNIGTSGATTGPTISGIFSVTGNYAIQGSGGTLNMYSGEIISNVYAIDCIKMTSNLTVNVYGGVLNTEDFVINEKVSSLFVSYNDTTDYVTTVNIYGGEFISKGAALGVTKPNSVTNVYAGTFRTSAYSDSECNATLSLSYSPNYEQGGTINLFRADADIYPDSDKIKIYNTCGGQILNTRAGTFYYESGHFYHSGSKWLYYESGATISYLNSYFPITVANSTYGYETYLIKSTDSAAVYELSDDYGTRYSNALQTAIDATYSGGTITALIDNKPSGAVSLSKTLTLNPGSKTITMTGTFTNSGTLNISGSGTITNASANTITNTGTLNVTSATISYTGTSTSKYAIYNSGTTTITGGTIRGVSYGIVNKGTLTIGNSSNAVSTSSPKIIGNTYSVYAYSAWNFYDGALYGIYEPTYYNSGVTAPTIPSGYHLVTATDTTYNTSGTKTYLSNVDGWVTVGSNKYYYENGAKVTGLKTIGNNTYYFDSNGVMQTGWQDINSYRYYFNSSGVMLKGSTLASTSSSFYVDSEWNSFHTDGRLMYLYVNRRFRDVLTSATASSATNLSTYFEAETQLAIKYTRGTTKLTYGTSYDRIGFTEQTESSPTVYYIYYSSTTSSGGTYLSCKVWNSSTGSGEVITCI